MAVWTCADCTTDYAVGLPKCPQCGSVVRIDDRPLPKDEERDMPKITVHGGATNAAEGSEDVSAGTSSTTSSAKEQPSTEPSEKQAPSRARSTGSRSGRNREAAGSTARPTAIGGRKTAGDHSDQH